MKLQAIRIQNYKSFKDSGWIELGKLTLLLGYNSNGKSTVLKAINLIHKCCDCQQMGIETAPFCPDIENDGNFRDILFQGKSKSAKAITFSLRFFNDGNNGDDEFKFHDVLELSVSARLSKSRTSTYINYVSVSLDGKSYYQAAMDEDGTGTANIIDHPEITKPIFNIQNTFFLILKPDVLNNSDISELARLISGNSNLSLVDFGGDLEYIMPVRMMPSRSMSLSAISQKGVGIDGGNTYNYLYKLGSEEKTNEEQNIQHWLGLFGYKYYWKPINTNFGSFMLKDLKTGYAVNIVDTGMGISQILPIIVASNMDVSGTLLIDSPEAHLHPKLQSEFANMFVDTAKRRDVVLETHSQNILLRIEKLIANHDIDKDFVRVYFIKDEGESSICEEIHLNENGDAINASREFKQFFSTAYEDVMDILKAKGKNA